MLTVFSSKIIRHNQATFLIFQSDTKERFVFEHVLSTGYGLILASPIHDSYLTVTISVETLSFSLRSFMGGINVHLMINMLEVSESIDCLVESESGPAYLAMRVRNRLSSVKFLFIVKPHRMLAGVLSICICSKKICQICCSLNF